jgi:hypothetical protein
MTKKIIFLCVLLTIGLTSCGGSKKVSKKIPQNAQERARQNVEEGRGISVKGLLGGSKNTNYEFSSSNPMWRATLEIIDFMPLTTVDYSGGIIITDWYSDNNNNELIKITVRFLSTEIAANNLKIIVHQKKCINLDNCKIVQLNTSLNQELTSSILKKAALLEFDAKNQKK